MSDDLDEIERLARAVEEANAAILAARSGSATITQAALYDYAAARTVYEETLTPARVLALVARLRRAEEAMRDAARETARRVTDHVVEEIDEHGVPGGELDYDTAWAIADEEVEKGLEYLAALSSEPSHG